LTGAAFVTGAPAPSAQRENSALRELPIGVFDSGVGGLTVLGALREELPNESLVYLGDTARLPYGTKSPETVSRYAIQASRALVGQGVKLLVVACNTASALAMERLSEAFRELPVIGVVRPGAEAAGRASRSGRIAVVATESTASHGAYEREIRRVRPDAVVTSRGCSLFVALAEEGWTHGPIAEAVAREYLTPMFDVALATRPDCLVLGCTHFPALADTIASVVGASVRIVDSAATTAAAVRAELERRGTLRVAASKPTIRLIATDAPDRFARVAARFLPEEHLPAEIELLDL
jgi:glutamate racemase